MNAEFARRLDKYARKMLKMGKGGKQMPGSGLSIREYIKGKKRNEAAIKTGKKALVGIAKQKKKASTMLGEALTTGGNQRSKIAKARKMAKSATEGERYVKGKMRESRIRGKRYFRPAPNARGKQKRMMLSDIS